MTNKLDAAKISTALEIAVKAWDEHYTNIYDDEDAHISLQKSVDTDGDISWRVEIMPAYEYDMTHWKDGDDAAEDIRNVRKGNASNVASDYVAAWDESWNEAA